MKADFLFAGVNVGMVIQKKTQGKCTFYGWWFKNNGH